MASKEEIQKFIDEIKSSTLTRRTSFSINEMVDMLERAVKDLEVLEIIKNHIVGKNFEYGSDFDSYNKISFTAEIMQLKDFTDKSNGLHYTTFKVDNGFEKVKEWLYNDK